MYTNISGLSPDRNMAVKEKPESFKSSSDAQHRTSLLQPAQAQQGLIIIVIGIDDGSVYLAPGRWCPVL